MTADDPVLEIIQQCRLDIKPDEARQLLGAVSAAISTLDTAQKNAVLLVLERFVLKAQGGHRMSLKFGHSDAVNNPDCIICRRPVDSKQWSVRLISRWENTQLWITWHDYCLGPRELEIEYDILTGTPTSPVGFA